MGIAREKNPVDIELYDFISATFCRRLREVGLIDEPLVVAELMSDEALSAM